MGSSFMKRTRKEAAVFMCGALEYLTAEILDGAGEMVKEKGKKQIRPRHLRTVLMEDEEFETLTKGCQLPLIAGQAPKEIHPELLSKGMKKKLAKEKEANSQ